MVNLPIEFSDKKVTSFGSISLMNRFLDLLNEAAMPPKLQPKPIFVAMKLNGAAVNRYSSISK